MKKAYLVHGWSGNPNNCWFSWLKSQLEQNGFMVQSLELPMPDEPNPDTWPAALENQISSLDADTYLIGHSMGCQTIMRYLANQPDGTQVGGVLFVAPFYQLLQLQTQEEKDIWAKWENKPFDLEGFRARAGKITAIFSDDDPDVDLKANEPFFKAVGAKTIVEHGKGHFTDDDGVMELPSALEEIIRISR